MAKRKPINAKSPGNGLAASPGDRSRAGESPSQPDFTTLIEPLSISNPASWGPVHEKMYVMLSSWYWHLVADQVSLENLFLEIDQVRPEKYGEEQGAQ